MSEQLGSATMDLPSIAPGMDRRASVRHPSILRVTYRPLCPMEDAVRQAQVRDVSTLGVGLVLPHPAALSTLLHLAFDGATVGGIRAPLARVVHASADAGRVVGCAFVRELDDATLRFFQAGRVGTATEDGRRWVRFPCNVETACYVLDTTPGERSPARIINISAGGAGLLLPCEFGAGTLLKLDLQGTPASVAGQVLLRVVRAIERADGDWFLGCEFAHQLSGEELKNLLK